MRNRELLNLLAVGLSRPLEATPTVDTLMASSGRQAIAALRMLRFDLLLAGAHVPDMSVWTLMQRVRTAWPDQRWALVSAGASHDDEVRARSLGALCVYDRVPDAEELALLAGALQPGRAVSVAYEDDETVTVSKAS